MTKRGSDRIRKLRGQINRIDEQIVSLLDHRAHLAEDIGVVKNLSGRDFYNPAREHAIYRGLLRKKTGYFPKTGLLAVFREIQSACLNLESPLKITYLGPEASYTHIAAREKFGDSASYLAAGAISDVFDEVARGSCSYGMVPIETTTGGTVTHTLDVFLESDLQICSELTMAPGPAGIRDRGIEDRKDNYTRFLVIGKNCSELSGDDKTSIVFGVKDVVGILHRMLEPFRKYKINLCKIESRLSRTKLWDYAFFIDFNGHHRDNRVKKALAELGRDCVFLKILGSYPRQVDNPAGPGANPTGSGAKG